MHVIDGKLVKLRQITRQSLDRNPFIKREKVEEIFGL